MESGRGWRGHGVLDCDICARHHQGNKCAQLKCAECVYCAQLICGIRSNSRDRCSSHALALIQVPCHPVCNYRSNSPGRVAQQLDPGAFLVRCH
jgi:hypothetical protein